MYLFSEFKLNYWKVAITAVLAWYFIAYAVGDPMHTLANWNLVDYADLIFHEAGHVAFMVMGDFMHVLGGSLFQIFIPLLFLGYFLFVRRELFSSAVVLYWLGENLISVSTYMGDAVMQQLPLLGGESVIHDWNYLFTATGLLRNTAGISHTVYILGFTIIIAATIFCILGSIERRKRNVIIDI